MPTPSQGTPSFIKSANYLPISASLLAGLIFVCCHSNPENQAGQFKEVARTTSSNLGENIPDSLKVYYFDFDEVDYYHVDTGHVYFGEDTQLSDEQKLFMNVFERDFPRSITDTAFVAGLPALGYIKKEIDPSKNEALNDLLREKGPDDFEVAACIPEYRDILIFRKAGTISGIAKVCFTCSAFFAAGTEAKTGWFGSYDGFSKLGALLHEETEN